MLDLLELKLWVIVSHHVSAVTLSKLCAKATVFFRTEPSLQPPCHPTPRIAIFNGMTPIIHRTYPWHKTNSKLVLMFLQSSKLPMEREKGGKWTLLRRIIIGYVSTAKQVDHKLHTCL